MKLEASLKRAIPQGLAITDSSKSTSPDRITGTDIMAALGSTAAKARFGLWAFLGKNGISAGDEQKAVQELARMAMDDAPKNVRRWRVLSLGSACSFWPDLPLLNIRARRPVLQTAHIAKVKGWWMFRNRWFVTLATSVQMVKRKSRPLGRTADG